MQITKFIHSCLLVETADRTALFDPGIYSTPAIDINRVERLDDVFITHVHLDHQDTAFLKQLISKFPEVRITTTEETVQHLASEGIKATTKPPDGVEFFDSPHASKGPLMPVGPEEIGIHYLGKLSHPGDSHSFSETKAILALPVTAPWGSSFNAISLACELKPQHVLPIHDWHWRDEAREAMYERFEQVFGEQGITFHKLQTAQPIRIDA